MRANPVPNTTNRRLLLFTGPAGGVGRRSCARGWCRCRSSATENARSGRCASSAARITVEPRRGVIYDRNGVELAMSIDVDSVFAVPSEIPDQETTAALLGNVLNLDPRGTRWRA